MDDDRTFDGAAQAIPDAMERLRIGMREYEERQARDRAVADAQARWRKSRSSFKNPDTVKAYGGRRRKKR